MLFKVSGDTDKLPDPRGPLCMEMPSSSVKSANKEVKQVIESEENCADWRKSSHYDTFSPELRYQIGKHAAENGVAAMWFYAEKLILKEVA